MLRLRPSVLFLCLCTTLSLHNSVQANAVASGNVMEVYFIVDRQSLAKYEAESSSSSSASRLSDAKTAIRKDIDYFITEINGMFTTMNNYGQYGVDIKVAIRGLTILDNNIFSAASVNAKGEITPDSALSQFDNYLASQNALSTYSYDTAMLWTGFNLYKTNGDGSTAGYAHIGTVCKGVNASAVSEFDGTYSTAVTTAHELAHNLGSTHDSASSGYVMAPSSSATSANRWTFSVCSASNIAATLGALSSNCLQSTNPSSSIPNVGIPSGLDNADTICRRKENSQASFMCHGKNFYGDQVPQGDAVCKAIYCDDVDKPNYCLTATSSDGIVCGTGKSCDRGVCITDPNGKYQDANVDCLFGDQAKVEFSGSEQTCEQFISPYIRNCENNNVKEKCCVTCKKYNTGIPGCEYGDKSTQCSNYTPDSSFCATNGATCCQLCNGVSRRRRSTDTNDNESDVVVTPTNVPPIHSDEKKKENNNNNNGNPDQN